jgi:hypothetical protein
LAFDFTVKVAQMFFQKVALKKLGVMGIIGSIVDASQGNTARFV